MGNEKKELKIIRKFSDIGVEEDIYVLKYPYKQPKSGSIVGTNNQVNTVGATSSKPEERE